ncbi:MAG: Hsp20/alpha crystallin family protein [Proteobacteria bacterium]|nr:Hsp20/alpha crystallin family protein [Pseudomonadota bacterium]
MAENVKKRVNLYTDFIIDDVFTIDPTDIENGCSFSPHTDIVEKDDAFIIQIDLPGIPKEDIEVEVIENTVSVQGVKKREQEGKSCSIKYYCMGRSYGRFKRRYHIPKPFNTKEVKAKLDNGLLVIILPKLIEKRQKKVKIPVE